LERDQDDVTISALDIDRRGLAAHLVLTLQESRAEW
jgi:hypothetical protein